MYLFFIINVQKKATHIINRIFDQVVYLLFIINVQKKATNIMNRIFDQDENKCINNNQIILKTIKT